MKPNDFLLCTFEGDTNNPAITYVAEIIELNLFTNTFVCELVDNLQRFTFNYDLGSTNPWNGTDTNGNEYLINSYYIYSPNGIAAPLLQPQAQDIVLITCSDGKKYLCYVNNLTAQQTEVITYNYPYYNLTVEDLNITQSDWDLHPVDEQIISIETCSLNNAITVEDYIRFTSSLISKTVENSLIAKYNWKGGRGIAPIGYLKGIAMVFARDYCRLKNNEPFAIEMAKANTKDTSKDALAWFEQEFLDLDMDNSNDGVDTLRHLFVLLIGLGMRESSGRYCEGKYTEQNNISADTAEAGLFQSSYNLRTAHSLLPMLFDSYVGKTDFLEIFKEKKGGQVECKEHNKKNYGTGIGVAFQQLSKTCPAFATEYAAIGARNRRKLWNPIIEKSIELLKESDDMLLDVQVIADKYYNLCQVVL
ncbi:hypothetical protein [Ferruginibacter sp.]|nr:hypothetical protein [Ferruginibacter sp.]